MEGEAVTWDEAALERVFDEATKEVAGASTMPDFIFGVDEALGSDETVVRLVQADGSVGPPVKARWTVGDTPIVLAGGYKRILLHGPPPVDPAEKAKQEKLQKERRANQQHFRHHGAKR